MRSHFHNLQRRINSTAEMIPRTLRHFNIQQTHHPPKQTPLPNPRTIPRPLPAHPLSPRRRRPPEVPTNKHHEHGTVRRRRGKDLVAARVRQPADRDGEEDGPGAEHAEERGGVVHEVEGGDGAEEEGGGEEGGEDGDGFCEGGFADVG